MIKIGEPIDTSDIPKDLKRNEKVEYLTKEIEKRTNELKKELNEIAKRLED